MKKQRKKSQKVAKGGRPKKEDVVALRRSCDVKGTGLSHYILADMKGKQ